jgi:hypothetical protein
VSGTLTRSNSDGIVELGENVRCLSFHWQRGGRDLWDELVDQPVRFGLGGHSVASVPVGRRRGRRCLLRWFEIVGPAPDLSRERQARRPGRRLQEDGKEIRLRDRSGRHFGDRLIVYGENDRNAAGFKPFDRCGQQIAGGALHHILDESPEPAAIVAPLAAGVVLEQHVGIAVLVFAGDKTRLRIGDPATGGQGEIEIAVLVAGDNPTGGKRLPSADGNANRTRELVPVFDRRGMGVAPSPNIGEDLLVRALVVGDDAPPRADGATEAAGEVSSFALVTLLLRDAGNIIPLEHLPATMR